jgi:hypothetical protein
VRKIRILSHAPVSVASPKAELSQTTAKGKGDIEKGKGDIVLIRKSRMSPFVILIFTLSVLICRLLILFAAIKLSV